MSEPELPEDLGDKIFQSVWEQFIGPEVERRLASGELPADEPLYRVQVVFNVDTDPEVRLNREVRGYANVRAARPIEAGEEVTLADIAGFEGYVLSEDDPNAAHVTLLRHGETWGLTWDSHYNAQRIAEHIKAAEEYVRGAEDAASRTDLRRFVEDALHASELLAKAELLALPDEVVFSAKSHGSITSRYNEWADLGNADIAFAKLLNELHRLRPAATYLQKPFALEAADAAEMLATLKQMREHVTETAPSRDLKDTRRRQSYTMRAAQDIKAGELIMYPRMTRLGGGKRRETK